MNKTSIHLILPFFCSLLVLNSTWGQNVFLDTIQSVEIKYVSEWQQLSFDFKENQGGRIKVDWKKYPAIHEIAIFNYTSTNTASIKGLKKQKVYAFRLDESDFDTFIAHNKFPKKLRKFGIWKNYLAPTDTLVVPEEIQELKHLDYFFIGCCNLIALDQVDWSQVKKLDTLILEGPLYDVNPLASIKRLDYLGHWNDGCYRYQQWLEYR